MAFQSMVVKIEYVRSKKMSRLFGRKLAFYIEEPAVTNFFKFIFIY